MNLLSNLPLEEKHYEPFSSTYGNKFPSLFTHFVHSVCHVILPLVNLSIGAFPSKSPARITLYSHFCAVSSAVMATEGSHRSEMTASFKMYILYFILTPPLHTCILTPYELVPTIGLHICKQV